MRACRLACLSPHVIYGIVRQLTSLTTNGAHLLASLHATFFTNNLVRTPHSMYADQAPS